MIDKDILIMQKCIEYARRYSGLTKSNPKVGSALVDKNGEIIKISAHKKFGSKHAEIELLDDVQDLAKGGKIYLTLEPCSTTGKTPPCVDRLIASGAKEVVIALLDPSPVNHFHGTKKLIDAGIKVTLGVAAVQAAELIEDFIKSQQSDIPYIRAKLAMSMDGMIATKTGESQWITDEASRVLVHKLRSEVGAVMTGIGTVHSDDPTLNSRMGDAISQPMRVILDSKLSIAHRSSIVKTAKDIDTVIFVNEDILDERIKYFANFGVKVVKVAKGADGYLDIYQVLKTLKQMNIIDIMVEAGSTLLGTFKDRDLIDKYHIFLAPMIIGGSSSMRAVSGAGSSELSNIDRFLSYSYKKLNNDIYIDGKQKNYIDEIVTKTFEVRDRLCLQD